MTITLREINHENWRAVIKLKVAAGQDEFVAPNDYSLLQANYDGPDIDFYPWAVYAYDTPVGFVMYAHSSSEGKNIWAIWRLMIDEAHQRKGFGRAALRLTVEKMRDEHQCHEILISFVPENAAVQNLYAQEGFEDTGRVEDGEIVYRLDLTNA